ncbi:hypothetical protein BDZ97DRAFT_1301562 [Flammula alnicola]|nr:hypothetical protein BDZ97DRAFT_1301562 [Flammula alnicola]
MQDRDGGGVFMTSMPPPPHHLPRMQERDRGGMFSTFDAATTSPFPLHSCKSETEVTNQGLGASGMGFSRQSDKEMTALGLVEWRRAVVIPYLPLLRTCGASSLSSLALLCSLASIIHLHFHSVYIPCGIPIPAVTRDTPLLQTRSSRSIYPHG